jgi:hypothetical protein
MRLPFSDIRNFRVVMARYKQVNFNTSTDSSKFIKHNCFFNTYID